jgi:hypothetical protein
MHLLAALVLAALAALAVCYSPAFVAPAVGQLPKAGQWRLYGASPGEVYGLESNPRPKLDVLYKAGSAMGLLATTQLLGARGAAAAEEEQKIEEKIISRADVGLIDLNTSEPQITSVCWIDLRIGDNTESKRVEISLYGELQLQVWVLSHASTCLSFHPPALLPSSPRTLPSNAFNPHTPIRPYAHTPIPPLPTQALWPPRLQRTSSRCARTSWGMGTRAPTSSE